MVSHANHIGTKGRPQTIARIKQPDQLEVVTTDKVDQILAKPILSGAIGEKLLTSKCQATSLVHRRLHPEEVFVLRIGIAEFDFLVLSEQANAVLANVLSFFFHEQHSCACILEDDTNGPVVFHVDHGEYGAGADSVGDGTQGPLFGPAIDPDAAEVFISQSRFVQFLLCDMSLQSIGWSEFDQTIVGGNISSGNCCPSGGVISGDRTSGSSVLRNQLILGRRRRLHVELVHRPGCGSLIERVKHAVDVARDVIRCFIFTLASKLLDD